MNKGVFSMQLVDRQAELGEPLVLEVRVETRAFMSGNVSVSWYHNHKPIREDLYRDIRTLCVQKLDCTVLTLVVGTMTPEFAGNYEIELQCGPQKHKSSCRVQPVPPGTLTQNDNPHQNHFTNTTAYQTPSNVISSKNTGLYSQQNINSTYSQFAGQNNLPQPAVQKQVQYQGYASDVMDAVNHSQPEKPFPRMGKTQQFLQQYLKE